MNIREKRKEKGITMKELGARIGCSESAISQYETGKRSPDYETLLKLAEELDTSVNYLLTGTDIQPTTRPGVSDEEIKLALWNGEKGMTDEQYQEIKNFANFIKMRNQ